jgi:hypothetical protein
MLEIIRELLGYMRAHKKLWLLPMLAILGAAAALLWAAQGSALAPFIYSVF